MTTDMTIEMFNVLKARSCLKKIDGIWHYLGHRIKIIKAGEGRVKKKYYEIRYSIVTLDEELKTTGSLSGLSKSDLEYLIKDKEKRGFERFKPCEVCVKQYSCDKSVGVVENGVVVECKSFDKE